MSLRPKNCGVCGAELRWVTPLKGGAIPIDPEPSPRGTVILYEGQAIVYRSVASIQEARLSEPRYTKHDDTCPGRK